MAAEGTNRVSKQISFPRCVAEADRYAERLDSLYRVASDTAASEVELYHRASVTLRMSQRAEGESVATIGGDDDGLAVRTRSRGGKLAFAACSGMTRESLRWALDACRKSESGADVRAGRWCGRGELLDREAIAAMPDRHELTEWVRRARPASGPCPLELWVEVATTFESWAAKELRASRTRTRAWAFLRMPGERGAPRPAIVAARRWSDLPADGWNDILGDRYCVDRPESAPPEGPTPVLFTPETSAIVVRALVQTLHVGESDAEIVVGPAWKVIDDPADPRALYGGTFDDAGFKTRRRRLADGKRVVGRIFGAGHGRRPSFRDRPTPGPSQIVVAPASAAPPSRAVLVSGVALHVLAPDRWVLEIDGAMLEDCRPGARLRAAFIRVDPKELVRRCFSAVGPPRTSHLGVRTPALVFDALSIK